MSDPIYANLMRGVVQTLDRRAKTISPHAFVTLTCWPDKWQFNVWYIGGSQKQFEGPEPQPLIDQADEFIKEHEPDTVARTLGLELLQRPAAVERPKDERCPDCGEAVSSIFDHIDQDCVHP